jgi:hypothetical protein
MRRTQNMNLIEFVKMEANDLIEEANNRIGEQKNYSGIVVKITSICVDCKTERSAIISTCGLSKVCTAPEEYAETYLAVLHGALKSARKKFSRMLELPIDRVSIDLQSVDEAAIYHIAADTREISLEEIVPVSDI